MLKKRKPLIYVAHRVRDFLDLDLYDVTRVITGSTRAYGMDISHWEGSFDPDQAIHGLIDFAIFKVSEGTTWVDDVFEKNYQASVGKVPIIGAYHYLRNGMSGRTQADHFTSIVGAKQIDILVCDFESTNNQMNDAFLEIAQEFGYYVKLWKPNCKLLFYTNPSTYDNVVYPGSMRLYGKDVFTEQPWDGFWVAQYYLSPSPDKDPAMPKTRKDWVIWQYSEAGDPDQHGTEGWVDQNVFNGDVSELSAWIGVENPVPPPIIGENNMYEFVSNTNQMSLRNGPSVLDEKIDSFAPGTVFSGDFIFPYPVPYHTGYIGDLWLHITAVAGTAVDGWVAVVHQGVTYGEVTIVEGNPTKIFPDVITAKIDDETKDYDIRA